MLPHLILTSQKGINEYLGPLHETRPIINVDVDHSTDLPKLFSHGYQPWLAFSNTIPAAPRTVYHKRKSQLHPCSPLPQADLADLETPIAMLVKLLERD